MISARTTYDHFSPPFFQFAVRFPDSLVVAAWGPSSPHVVPMDPDSDTITVDDIIQVNPHGEIQPAHSFSCNIRGKSYTRLDRVACHSQSSYL